MSACRNAFRRHRIVAQLVRAHPLELLTLFRANGFVAEIASAGRHAVFRFYLEYPNKPLALPQFLVDAGVTIHTNIVTEGVSKERMLTPDYEDPRLRAALGRFIVALGARYDGDVRIGFITAGLLGKWGEWHDHPSHKLWASKAV